MRPGKNGVFLGVDGCTGGWILSAFNHGRFGVFRFDSLADIVSRFPDFDEFLIDMVMGLQSNPSQLRPDSLARRQLSRRGSTIFPVPCRQAVYQDDPESQLRTNIEVLGKSLSSQTINIIPKIREVDLFLQENSSYKNRLYESHPELDFGRLKGEILLSSKKDEEGIRERIAILSGYVDLDYESAREKVRELRCQIDDLLDSICLCVCAALKSDGLYEMIPDDPQMDDTGLYMRLIAPLWHRYETMEG